MANTNVPVIDLPFFELCNQAPVITSAVSGITTSESGTDRFIYYLSTSAFFRYDTVADTWQQLASPNVAPVTALAMRYTSRRGFHGRILAATSTTVTIPAMRGPMLDGETISIEFGDGAGQERTLTFQSQNIHDAGVVTGVTALALTDTTKRWRVNQWAGYTVGIYYGTDTTHYRKILYNDTNTLYVVDANLQPHDPWNNQNYVAASPYVVPSITAGAQTNYMIISSTFSVNSAWTVTPNAASYFTTRSGGIYLLSSAAAAPFFSLQYYDVINDIWQTKTVPQGLISAALSTDFSIERTGKIGALYVSGTATSATSRTIVDSSLTLTQDRYANYRIYITGGTGVGQSRRIVAHTSNTFTVPRNWGVTPDATSTYEIWPDYDRIYLAGGAQSTVFAYSPENDYWMQGQAFDDGITNNISATLGSWLPIGVSTGVRIAAGVTAVAAAPTAGGVNYVIGDVLTCSVGGTGAQVRVTSIAPGGIVTGIELVNSGTVTGFTTGSGRATTGGAGTGCTIEITAVGATATITTASNHFFSVSNSITFAGCTEAAWNTAHTIIGVPALNTFCVAVTATANMVATASQSVTLIVDPTKSWVTNEHVGRIIQFMVAGQAPTSQSRWILSNTANTITVSTSVAPINGTSKYVIYDSKVFGIDVQRKETGMEPCGWASSGSVTTLVDSTKNWVPNQWAGYAFKIEAGTGYGSGRITITSNTGTTLTYTTQSFTPDATTKYEIADCWGIASAGASNSLTDSTKNWTANQWAGKRVRYTAGLASGNDIAVSSNTLNVLATGSGLTADATTAYAIIGIPPRGSGMGLIWLWGDTDAAKRGRYIYSPRGGITNQIDIYDITTGRWEYGLQFAPQGELFTIGSSYAYEGGSSFYASRSTTGTVNRILEIDTTKRIVAGGATTTWLQGTTHIGNFLEIVDANGIKFMYTLQTSGTLFSRCVIL
jgi:hypothetical protein